MYLKTLFTTALVATRAIAIPTELSSPELDTHSLLSNRDVGTCPPGSFLIYATVDQHLCLAGLGIAGFAAVYVGVMVPVLVSAFRGNCAAPVTGTIGADDIPPKERRSDIVPLPKREDEVSALAERAANGYYEYRWEKSGRNDCSTTMNPKTIVDVLNEHALDFVKQLKMDCAVFTLDNSGTFKGTYKVAYHDGTGLRNGCW